ncbi:MAG: HupE/UreJ family protein [Piscinibacter sp.]|uniref:HupE/UreJ family protein n=1 Tax=Piscinibacter TaxID=1114981 RepID=UPI000FDE6DEC|nr:MULTISPECIES: HupE/UreJ family protein [Piscinibacter]MCW5663144.1 HupE/UreJ family protein [Piscinibacter sp.]
MKRLLCMVVLFVAVLGAARAHQASDAYVQLNSAADGVQARLDIALRDLDAALGLDADGDGRLTWGEVRAAWPAIERLARAHVQFGRCAMNAGTPALERRSDGSYAVLHWRSACALADAQPVRYTLFADIDPTHRGLLRVEHAGQGEPLRVLDPNRPDSGAAGPRASLLGEGVRHIVTGYDHLLFLLCLLVPAVMRRERGADARLRWRPVARRSAAFAPVLGIVTAFTVAHSITLGLAAARWVAVPEWFIEPAIALTIVLAAIDNLRPIFPGPRVLVTFVFGLVHGFGFAGVLGELDLPAAQFAWALLQFNLGLELGQVAIVLAVATLLYAVRDHRLYPRVAIAGGSGAAMLTGLAWFVERTADLSLLPF